MRSARAAGAFAECSLVGTPRAGRTDKSGTWTSKGVGKYLAGGKAAGGMLVDQRFCPRIVEGELRYNCVGPNLVGIIHKKPKEGGISAVGGTGSVYTFYGPDEPKFANLTNNFLTKDIDKVMPSLGLNLSLIHISEPTRPY